MGWDDGRVANRSGSGRPVSRVGVRAFRVHGVCTGDFVEASGGGQPHGQRALGLAVLPHPRTARPSPEPERLLVRTVWRGVGRVAQDGGGGCAPWSSWEAQGRVAWSLRAFPAGQPGCVVLLRERQDGPWLLFGAVITETAVIWEGGVTGVRYGTDSPTGDVDDTANAMLQPDGSLALR